MPNEINSNSVDRHDFDHDVDHDFDVGVIGGGPSGLAAAIYAAMNGLSVVVFEPKDATIDKACGEGLMPSAVHELQEMGIVIPESHPFKGIRYINKEGAHTENPKNWADGHFTSGDGWGVRRLTLHKALLDRANELNVQWRHTRVQHVLQHKECVTLEDIRVRYCIAADGLHSPTRKRLGLSKPPKLPKRIGVRQHFEVSPWSPFVEVYWSEYGECYITPVSKNQVGVAILAYADHIPKGTDTGKFESLLEWFPVVQAKVQGANTLSSVRGAGGFEQRLHATQQGRILLVGDAAGYLDPITGEGIRLGLLSAKSAVHCIVNNEPARYRREHQWILAPYWILTGGLLWLRRFSLGRKIMIPFLQKIPFAFNRIVSILGG